MSEGGRSVCVCEWRDGQVCSGVPWPRLFLPTAGEGELKVVGSQLLNTDFLLHRPFWEQGDK